MEGGGKEGGGVWMRWRVEGRREVECGEGRWRVEEVEGGGKEGGGGRETQKLSSIIIMQ